MWIRNWLLNTCFNPYKQTISIGILLESVFHSALHNILIHELMEIKLLALFDAHK